MHNPNPSFLRKAVCFLSTLCVLLAVTAAVYAGRARSLQRDTVRTAQQSLAVLCAQLDNVETALQKSVYARSAPMFASLSSKIQNAAAGAKLSLSLLTDEQNGAAQIFRFLSQVGDYTAALQRELQRGKDLTADRTQALRDLCQYVSALGERLDALRAGLDDASLAVLPRQTGLTQTGTDSFSDAFSAAVRALPDYPALQYNGPFADAMLRREGKATKQLEEISLQTARSRAAKYLGCEEKDLVRESDESSGLELYCFSKAGRTVALTRRGGLLCYLTNPNYAGKSEIGEDAAVKVARAFLRTCGYKDMKACYASTYDGVCTVSFAYSDRDVTCYADRIKVSVALDTARVAAFDARDFLMNHTARTLPDVKIKLKTAARNLSDELDLLDHKTAVIAREDGTESLCHELHCRNKDGSEVLIYADTQQTGEADIRLLLRADDGVLAK